MISVQLDDRQVKANIGRLQRSLALGMVEKRVLDIGNEILRLSQREVPHDEGTLQNSGTVEEVNGDVIVGYHTPYAARLHEHPEYHFQKGRKGKYLEDPVRKNANTLRVLFEKGIDKEMRKLIR